MKNVALTERVPGYLWPSRHPSILGNLAPAECLRDRMAVILRVKSGDGDLYAQNPLNPHSRAESARPQLYAQLRYHETCLRRQELRNQSQVYVPADNGQPQFSTRLRGYLSGALHQARLASYLAHQEIVAGLPAIVE